MDLRFKHPFTSIIAGPTSCGKTYFLKKFVQNLDAMVDTRIDKVLWFYSSWQIGYQEFEDEVEFIHGLPNLEDFNDQSSKLVILDDWMKEGQNSVVDLFTKGSHHFNISVFFVTQNIFYKGRYQRDINLNCQYLILFKNPRDKAQIAHLARQLHPENPKFIQNAYNDATSEAHGYIVFDFKQGTSESFRIRTRIFPDDEKKYLYIPKNSYKCSTLAKYLFNTKS